MILRRVADERCSEQRFRVQLEGLLRLCATKPPALLGSLPGGKRADIEDLQFHRRWLKHDLRAMQVIPSEGGTQNLVPTNYLAERLLKRGNVQRSKDAQYDRKIVRAPRWGDLLEQPEPLLRKG
jgi:uncharacterized lipoprotein YmbA